LDLIEKRFDKLDSRLEGIETRLNEMAKLKRFYGR
jgi:hypothetical protein